MAKNISKNQWFKDIADGIYLDTAVLNNILIAICTFTDTVAENTLIGVARNPDLFNFNGHLLVGPTSNNNAYLELNPNGNLYLRVSAGVRSVVAFSALPLKSKQLETDFYTKEQLAEMYPDDPAYQPAVIDESKPVVVSNEEESES